MFYHSIHFTISKFSKFLFVLISTKNNIENQSIKIFSTN
jgi:hypothetical protein